MAQTHIIYLLTGGNLGDRIATLLSAKQLIQERLGKIVQTSSFYETAAWGEVDQPDYINQALEVATTLSPKEVLKVIFNIEASLGRVRRSKWESRPIDIDILFYDDLILETKELTIPHPRLHRRNFVLIPMLEIAPELVHPILKKTIEELYEDSEDDLDVILLEPVASGQ
ncbi:MAG: 2-amino-4-hydroxy-6-hydroxymethyldihydropteridine diphosphokinase [Lewinellaceae bacterium]|nr:2-amino-4-hydroxy-6-hydroxymethyldihydropteridine diphosphokinase [Saprospiraceae bacterium]MCB9340613.1 2-amino-4-hydroxy-6-hydroxymethyldihydropteridine diphosphokinase [Lewinellaceae bacterium]